MTGEAILSASVSRPKIHRLPAPSSRYHKWGRQARSFARRGMSNRPMVFAVGAAFAMVLLAVLLDGFVSLAAYHIGSLPTLATAHKSAEGQTLAAAQPMAQPNNTILLSGDDGTIVGQMTKLPLQNGPNSEINTISEVDKRTGRELLSIVGKY